MRESSGRGGLAEECGGQRVGKACKQPRAGAHTRPALPSVCLVVNGEDDRTESQEGLSDISVDILHPLKSF